MTTSAFWSIAGFAGGGGSGATLCVGDVVDPALVSLLAGEALAAALALFADVFVTALFLHVGKLRASRHGIRANRRSIKVGYA